MACLDHQSEEINPCTCHEERCLAVPMGKTWGICLKKARDVVCHAELVLITAGHIVCLFTLVMAIFLSLIIITLLHH